jgi:hypothetical protein
VPLLRVASLPRRIERVLPAELPNEMATPLLMIMFEPALSITSGAVPGTAPTLVILPPIVIMLEPDPSYSKVEQLSPS